jgi:hypothetical protein
MNDYVLFMHNGDFCNQCVCLLVPMVACLPRSQTMVPVAQEQDESAQDPFKGKADYLNIACT